MHKLSPLYVPFTQRSGLSNKACCAEAQQQARAVTTAQNHPVGHAQGGSCWEFSTVQVPGERHRARRVRGCMATTPPQQRIAQVRQHSCAAPVRACPTHRLRRARAHPRAAATQGSCAACRCPCQLLTPLPPPSALWPGAQATRSRGRRRRTPAAQRCTRAAQRARANVSAAQCVSAMSQGEHICKGQDKAREQGCVGRAAAQLSAHWLGA